VVGNSLLVPEGWGPQFSVSSVVPHVVLVLVLENGGWSVRNFGDTSGRVSKLRLTRDRPWSIIAGVVLQRDVVRRPCLHGTDRGRERGRGRSHSNNRSGGRNKEL